MFEALRDVHFSGEVRCAKCVFNRLANIESENAYVTNCLNYAMQTLINIKTFFSYPSVESLAFEITYYQHRTRIEAVHLH